MVDALIRISSFIIYLFMLNFFFSSWSSNTRISVKYLITLFFLALIVLINSYFIPTNIEPFINIAVTISAMIILAKHHSIPTKESVFLIIILLTINFICESLSLTVFDSILSPMYDSKNLVFVIITTSITMSIEILLFLMLKLFFFRNKIYTDTLTYPVLLSLTSIPIISIIVLFSFLLSNLNISVHSIFFALLIAFGILYMNICVLYLYNSLTKHLRKINQITLQNRALSSEMKYIFEVKKSQVQLKSMRHDLKNQFLVLLGLIEENQINEAKKYLQNSISQVSLHQHFYTHDIVLNYLLTEKVEFAKKSNISFNIKVLISKKIKIDNDILSILIGNLIDNAIKATNRLPNNHPRKISLVIKQFDDKLLIDIKNTFDSTEKKTRYQRQNDGLGINNVKRIVHNYNGLYKQWDENGHYLVSIVLLNII
ncbi:sensor histidine kinase [Dellaglioa sp. L3N]